MTSKNAASRKTSSRRQRPKLLKQHTILAESIVSEDGVGWRADGTWGRIVTSLLDELDDQGQIDHDLWCIDGSVIRACKAAAGAKKKNASSPQQLRAWFKRRSQLRGGWGRHPKGDAPSYEAGALGAR